MKSTRQPGASARRLLLPMVAASFAAMAVGSAHADAIAQLRSFVKEVQTGKASFTQVVTSPDGKKSRRSSGTLEFQRPDKFRFTYAAPTEQLIVGDGRQVWLYDSDLNQVTVRPMGAAVGASPAALLAGGSLDKDFTLRDVAPSEVASASSSGAVTATPATGKNPQQDGSTALDWVEALPRHKEGQFQSVRIGFVKQGPKQGQLSALEILDSFGQRSRLAFTQFESGVALPASRFQFTPPQGADVLRQP